MAYKPNTREYREQPLTFFLPDDVQESTQSSAYIVEGYATTFNKPYNMGTDSYECYEVIDAGALAGADMTDVIFQLNHEGQTLARQRTNTLTLTIDEHGLKVRADLSGSQAGRELYEAIKNGLIDRMSWGFTIKEGGWHYDDTTHTSHITHIDKVFDVSAVSIPANQDTEIHARSYLHGVMEEKLQELQQRTKDKRARISALLELQTL